MAERTSLSSLMDRPSVALVSRIRVVT
jgi:hypothetical protein